MTIRHLVGVVPAAGLGSRLPGLRYPKELLPVVYDWNPGDRAAFPRPAIQLSLDRLREGGVARSCIVISPDKAEIARILGDGTRAGMRLAYVIQEKPDGLADSVAVALPWAVGSHVCLALPDTVLAPANVFACLVSTSAATDADLVLGIFPTSHPEQLGPVRVDDAGAVTEVLDKPPSTDLDNTWGAAVWSPAFSALLERAVHGSASPPALGQVFDRAVRSGMHVRAVVFRDGSFADLGTPEGLALHLAHAPSPSDGSPVPVREPAT